MLLNKGHYKRKEDEYIGIIYDNVKQDYQVLKVKQPKSPAFIAKKPPSYIREYMKEEDCTKIFVPYKSREFYLADRLGMSNFKDDVLNKKYIKEMVYLNPSLYGADFNIIDTMLKDFLLKYEKDPSMYDNIHQAYLDIETDVLKAPGDNDKQPIYMFATYFDKENTVHLDWLARDEYGNQAELRDKVNWINKVKDNFIREINQNEKLSGKKYKAIRDAFANIINNAKYIITEFKDEMEMIRTAWQRVMRINKPNFLQIYNADYDVSQSYRRYKYLGGDPADLFTCPEIGNYYNLHCKTVRQLNGTYRAPKQKKFNPMNEEQWYETDSYTQIQDTQVIHYGLRTKEEDGYSLDATTKRELGFGKLDYTKTAGSIFHLPYADFALTAEYNIRDTMLLKALEMATDNMLANIIKRNWMATEWDRLFVSTPYCTNTFNYRESKKGIIQRNEINAYLNKMPRDFYEKLPDKLLLNLFDSINKKEDLAGGYVADPNKIRKKGPEFIRGVPNYKAHGRSIDIDAEAHYPSAIVSNNIGLESIWNEIQYIYYKYSPEDANRIVNTIVTEEASRQILKSTRDPNYIAMKIINRDVVGIGELFNLPGLESLTEMHYGIKVDWERFSQERIAAKYKFNPKYAKLKTVMRNIFNDKINQIDKNANMHSMSNHFSLSLGKDVHHSYYGSLVSYHLETEDGKSLNTLHELLLDFDHTTDNLFGKIIKDDTGEEYFEAIIDEDFIAYNEPKNEFDESNLEELDSEFMSPDTLEKISNARDFVYKYYLGTANNKGRYHIDLTNRLFASPNPKAIVKATLLRDKVNDDILFRFDSRLNIKLDKQNSIDLVSRQVFSILPILS